MQILFKIYSSVLRSVKLITVMIKKKKKDQITVVPVLILYLYECS